MSVAPDGRRMLRLEVRNAGRPRSSASRRGSRPGCAPAREYRRARSSWSGDEGLHTVCEEAGCPNIYECWEDREATFLIGGDQCTRRCDFCQIDTGKPGPARPRRAAAGRRVRRARWACATPPSPASPATTCPTRAPGCTPRRCAQIHAAQPRHRRRDADPRLLRPSPSCSAQVFDAAPEVLRPQPRDGAADLPADPAGVPLRALAGRAHARPAPPGWSPSPTSSSGMGETIDEVDAGPRRPARRPGCDLVTITQYLRPVAAPPPGRAWVQPEEFVDARARGRGRSGFAGVMSGPLVRSSYRAGRLYREAVQARSGADVRAAGA